MRLRSFSFLAALAMLTAFAACRSTTGDPAVGGSGTGACSGVTCSADEVCNVLPCGEGLPECVPRPTSCSPGGPQICGDDGKVYASACVAAQSGHDLGTGCKPPPGTFACGSFFCDPNTTFCQTSESTCGPATSKCVTFPSSCEPLPATCECLGGQVACADGDTADSTCTAKGNQLSVYCPQ
jgi:hypothetical protein